MTRLRSVLALILCLLVVQRVGAAPEARVRPLEMLGWVEYVAFADPPLKLKAKLDTGATTSSLNALNIEKFERNGKTWVRFEVLDPDDREQTHVFEAPVTRTVRIRRHEGPPQERYAVEIGMCLGNIWRKREFTLIDRSDFAYQVLVGRNFMRGFIAVDPNERFLSRPRCEELGLAARDDDETAP